MTDTASDRRRHFRSAEQVRSSPYWPVVSHPLLRRVLPGLAVSALGDGMALVAVTWLAMQLAPQGQRGTWTAVAVAAYTLPSAAGTIVFAATIALGAVTAGLARLPRRPSPTGGGPAGAGPAPEPQPRPDDPVSVGTA